MFTSNCQVTLYRRTVLSDGTFSFDRAADCQGFFAADLRLDEHGRTNDFSEVLLPADAIPAPGDELEINGLRRTVARVRCCSDINGVVRCCRCSFLRS